MSALALVGCADGDLTIPPDAPAEIRVIEGNAQVGSAGMPLSEPVVVKLVDRAGTGIPNRAVTWVVSAGGGRAVPQTSMTDADGLASTTWILGPSGGPNTLEAVVSDVGLVTFSAFGGNDEDGSENPPLSPSLSSLSATPGSMEVGAATTITVVVRDEAGRPRPGVTVVLRATGEGNSLSQPGATDATGTATGTLSSTTPGVKVISATVGGSVELSQTTQVTVTAPATVMRMELVEGGRQSAPAGASVPIRPAVRITDGAGQPVSAVEIIFVVTGGGGSVDGPRQITNSDGIARVGDWRLGTSPGRNTLEARAASTGLNPVVFTADGTAGGGVHHFVFRVPPRDVKEGEWFSVEVAMVDAGGTIVPVSDIEIYLGLFPQGSDVPNNGRLLGDRFRDTRDGVAVFELAISRKGRYRFRALSDELPSLGPHGPEPYLFSNLFEVK